MIDPVLAESVQTTLAGMSPGTFEAFVCDAVAELVGVRVRRARSGYQAGRDATIAGELPTMIECKRYTTSSLSDRELIGELHVAHTSGCELWVLAATCEVTDQTATHLEGAAAQLGITVYVLDWPAGQTKPLLVLAVGAPASARRYLDQAGDALSRHAMDADTLEAVSHLRRNLSAPAVSAEMLRRRLAERLDEGFDDPPALRRDFGARPPASPRGRDPWAGFVDRPRIEEQLSEWRTRDAPRGVPAVLLGDEGAGKSLVALRWLRDRARAGDLVIPVSSSVAFTMDDPVDVIAALLVRLFGDGAERWRMRIRSVLSQPAVVESLRVILYLDGINEQPDAPWAGLLNALQAKPLRGQVGVLMSCRPWPYEYRFAGFPALEHAPVRVGVGLFDDDELTRALALHGRRVGDFPAEMHPLLSRPRLFAMALRNEQALREAGEYTPARLFWEDWRDRLAAGRQILSDTQYRTALLSVARGLDRQFAAGHARTEAGVLRSAIDTALWAGERAAVREQTLSEIIDGGLARLDSAVLHLHPVFAALALGLELRFLLLERHRAGETDHLRLKDAAKLALEPWGGADFGASVARFAAWASVELADTPATLQSAVLALWLEEQNFAETHQEDAAAMVRRAPDAAFQAAEDIWLRKPGRAGLALQRAFEPALHPGFKGGTVRDEMKARVRRWAGWIRADRGQTGLSPRSTDTQRAEALARLVRRIGVPLEMGVDHEICGEIIRVSEGETSDGEAAAVSGLDTLMASGLADLGAIVWTTAVASAVQSAHDLTIACIRLLRRLDADGPGLRSALRGELARLRSETGTPGKEAADELAWMLDLPEASEVVSDRHLPGHWNAASPAYRDRFGPEYVHRVDEHVMREALLEPDASLTPRVLEQVGAENPTELHRFSPHSPHAPRPGAGIAGLAEEQLLEPVNDAAVARGFVPPLMPWNGLEAEAAAPVGAGPTTVLRGDWLDLLRAALFDSGAAQGEAWDDLTRLSLSRADAVRAELLAAVVHKVADGETTLLERDPRVLSGRWLAANAGSESGDFASLVDEVLAAGQGMIDAHLELRPGLMFGLTQGALLLGSPGAPVLWHALTTSWQDFYLLPDRRGWFWDLPFEAPDSPTTDRLRKYVLDATSTESQLMDVALSVRRWGRQQWLRSMIERDVAGGAAWRVARTLILRGMMGDEPPAHPSSDSDLAPAWLSHVSLSAFRYARRESRMRYWIQCVTELDDPQRIRAAVRVLEADADRRLSLVLADVDAPPARRGLVEAVVEKLEARDPHAAGLGLMEGFLEIPDHPWLGPPGMPHSPFR